MWGQFFATAALVGAALFLLRQVSLRRRPQPIRARLPLVTAWLAIATVSLLGIAALSAWEIAASGTTASGGRWFWATLGADSALTGLALMLYWHRVRLGRPR